MIHRSIFLFLTSLLSKLKSHPGSLTWTWLTQSSEVFPKTFCIHFLSQSLWTMSSSWYHALYSCNPDPIFCPNLSISLHISSMPKPSRLFLHGISKKHPLLSTHTAKTNHPGCYLTFYCNFLFFGLNKCDLALTSSKYSLIAFTTLLFFYYSSTGSPLMIAPHISGLSLVSRSFMAYFHSTYLSFTINMLAPHF